MVAATPVLGILSSVREPPAPHLVGCWWTGKVAAISLSDWKVTSLIDAGKGADGLAWAVAQ
jgi:hypothetical protein